MSNGARLTVAIVALLCAFGFAATAFTAPEAFPNPQAIYGCALFCVLVAVACAGGPAGETVRRLIAGVVCVAYVAYVVREVTAPSPVLLSGSRGRPDVLNSLAGLVLIGVPCGLYAALGSRLVERVREISRR